MQFLNAIAACLILVGGLNLAGSLRGSGHEFGGFGVAVVCLGFGVLLSAVANIGIKLNRIEKRLAQSSDDPAETSLD